MPREKVKESYDLWDAGNHHLLHSCFNNSLCLGAEESTKNEEDEGLTHYLRQTGKLKPKFKNNYVPSVLPSVEIAKAGASYNPAVDDYMVYLNEFRCLISYFQSYVNKIAAEEDVEIRKEKRVKRVLSLRPGDTYCTPVCLLG